VTRWRTVVAATKPLARLQSRYVREQPGFDLICATAEPAHALAVVSTLQPHLVLVEVGLAGGGLVLLAEVRALRVPVEAIVTGADPDADTVRGALRLGALDYLAAPFEPERLRRSLAAFRRRMAVDAAVGPLTQDEIDCLVRRDSGRWLPRDLDERRLRQVRAALRLHGGPLTADELADSIGVARTTAWRYLEYLVTVGDASVELLPAGYGRPPKAYSARNWSLAA
jgi:two-component system, CitB family, response regulator DctR